MESDRKLEVGDVVVWSQVDFEYSRRHEYPQPLVVVETSRIRWFGSDSFDDKPDGSFYVKVRDAKGKLRVFGKGERFDQRWFVYDPFLTAVRKRRLACSK